jgi:hypothetical protein
VNHASAHPLSPIVADHVVDPDRADLLHGIYVDAFQNLQQLAAARHLFTRSEFLDEMADPRIVKYSAWRDPDHPVALATVTTDLSAVTWISPHFFSHRHPELARRAAIHYLGFAMVTPGRGHYRLLERLVHAAVQPCLDDQGVLIYDVCGFNDRRLRLGRRSESLLNRVAPVRVEPVDVQTYYEASFP